MFLLSAFDYWIGMAVLSALALFYLLSAYCFSIADMRRKRMFTQRGVMPFAVWYETHYHDLGELCRDQVEAIVRVFSDEIGVHPTQLLPSDCILKDYGLRGICSLLDDSWEAWMVGLPDCFARITGRAMTEQESTFDQEWVTLDDFVRGMIVICTF